MKLSELADKPKLIELLIDKPEIIEKYGEAVQFHMLDRLPISTFTKLATIKDDNVQTMYEVMKDIILDEDGKTFMSDNNVLPMDVLTECIVMITDYMGKSLK